MGTFFAGFPVTMKDCFFVFFFLYANFGGNYLYY